MKTITRVMLYTLLFILFSTSLLYKLISVGITYDPKDISLIINEYMTQNKSTLLDNSGESPDWIEVLNYGTSDLKLKDYALSDDDKKPLKWRFPDYTLKPSEYLVIFASGKNKNFPEFKEFHTNFKLGSDDKSIILSYKNKIIDSVEIKPGAIDTSVGRATLSDKVLTGFTEPSPGFPNSKEGYLSFLESKLIKDSPLQVSEFMYSNKSTLRDEDWEYPDWIEIYNNSNNSINLKGYGFSDDPSSPFKWRFPDTSLESGEYLVVLASGKNKFDTVKNLYHTNFRLSVEDTIVLSSPEGKILDNVKVTPLEYDTSLGRLKGENNNWVEFSHPTPGYENSGKGYSELTKNTKFSFGPVISEALASNTWQNKDEDGDYSDWVEIYNPSSSSLNLQDYYLSDDPDELLKWRLPSGVLKSGQYLVVYASGKNRGILGKPLHTNFKLNNNSEAVYVSDSSGKLLNKLVTGELPPGVACGIPEGGPGFSVFEKPTPGFKNPKGFNEICKAPTFSSEGGIYKEAITLNIETPPSAASVHYTLDGSKPSINSPIYTTPIDIDKTTVVRAIALSNEGLQSTVKTETFFINPRTDLPLISVSTDPKNFWDENTGIYTKGLGASPVFPYQGANFWKDIEKPIHIELYETNGSRGFSMDAGIKIFGAYSRAMEQKSFSIIAREEYGKATIDYKVFKEKPIDKFNSLVLRTSGQDAILTKIRDPMMTRLSSEMGLDVQAYRPSVLYVNGEYFGIYNIREKIDEYYLASNHKLDNPKAIDILEANGRVKVGDNSNYKALLDYVSRNDLRVKSNYEYVKTQMDVYNYMDYQISEMYFGNTDSGNISYWRENSPKGKWRWIVYDTDWGFFNVKHNTVAFNLHPDGTGVGKYFSTLLVRKLMENDEFREEFLRRFALRLGTTLTTDRVISIIDEMAKAIEPEMPFQLERWGGTMPRWKSQIEVLRDFARQRPSYLYGYIKDYFNLSDEKMKELGFKKP